MNLSGTKKHTLNTFVASALPISIFILFFTNPFAKVVASITSSICIILFLIRFFILKDILLQERAKTYYLIMLIYLAAMIASLVNTSDLHSGIRLLNGQLFKFVLAFMMVEVVASAEDAKKYLTAFVAGGAVLAAITLYEGVAKHLVRPPSMWNAVHGGNLLMFPLITMIVLMIYEKKTLVKAVYLSLSLLTSYALYLNGTRGAWVAFGTAMLVLPFLFTNMTFGKKLAIAGMLLLAVTALVQVTSIREQFRNAESNLRQYRLGERNNSLGWRIDMWKASTKMFQEHPFIGVGMGDWNHELEDLVKKNEAPDSILVYNQTHNMYLDALSTRGIIGLLTFLAITAYPIFSAWNKTGREYEPYRTIIFCTTLAFTISGMTDTLVYIRGVYVSYLILIGLSVAIRYRAPLNLRL
jgi:O-antigen ligase